MLAECILHPVSEIEPKGLICTQPVGGVAYEMVVGYIVKTAPGLPPPPYEPKSAMVFWC